MTSFFLARNCRREYDANQTEKPRKAKLDNANEKWKLLKGITKPQKKSISDTEFYDYFVKVSNSNNGKYKYCSR